MLVDPSMLDRTKLPTRHDRITRWQALRLVALQSLPRLAFVLEIVCFVFVFANFQLQVVLIDTATPGREGSHGIEEYMNTKLIAFGGL